MSVYPKNDAWCESPPCSQTTSELIICEEGEWRLGTKGELGLASLSAIGTKSVYITGGLMEYYALLFHLYRVFDAEAAQNLCFQLRESELGGGHFKGLVSIWLLDANGNYAIRNVEMILAGAWISFAPEVGSKNAWMWQIFGQFDWTKIQDIRFDFWMHGGSGSGTAYVDDLHFILKQAYAFLWIRSQPTQDVAFNIDGSPGKTDTYIPQIPGTEISVVIAEAHDSYAFDHWETPWGSETSPTITFTIWEDMTIIAHYAGGPPPLAKVEVHVIDPDGNDVEGATVTMNGNTQETNSGSLFFPGQRGVATFNVAVGSYAVHAEKSGVGSADSPLEVTGDRGATIRLVSFTPFDQLWNNFKDFSEKLHLPVPPKPPSPPTQFRLPTPPKLPSLPAREMRR